MALKKTNHNVPSLLVLRRPSWRSSASLASLASTATDADDRLSLSSHSTVDVPRPLGLGAMRRLRPKRPLPRQQQQQQQPHSTGGSGGGSAYGKPGKRWKRRQVNEAFLHSLATVTEVTEEDISGCHWPESPLSSLFLDPEQMRAWRQFADLTDEQQADFLARAGGDDGFDEAGEPLEEEEEELAEDAELKAVLVQPARVTRLPSSGQAWGRLSATCRDFALRRAIPGSRFHAELDRLEGELRDLFQDGCAPHADWVSGPLSPCDRLVVHCAATYLGLQSASESVAASTGVDNSKEERRSVCVRRQPNRLFRPPRRSLTDYLAGQRALLARRAMHWFQ